ASAVELADDLQCFREGLPIAARPTGQLERAWRWCLRNPALATALTVAAALLLGGAGVSSYFALSEAAQAETAWNEEQAAIAARAELEVERDKLQTALARSLLGPLAPQNPDYPHPYRGNCQDHRRLRARRAGPEAVGSGQPSGAQRGGAHPHPGH